jgi:hypothetical protein
MKYGRSMAQGLFARQAVIASPENPLGAIAELGMPFLFGAVSATKSQPNRLDAMTDDRTFAMRAPRGRRLYRTFERIERPCVVGERYLECLVVVVAALIASRHRRLH